VSMTKYGQLVESASNLRDDSLEKAFRQHTSAAAISVWAQELDIVNKHITVDSQLVEDAANSYEELGRLLVERLRWPEDAISIAPQGSTNTKTLVRAPTAERFDIDAVCEVDLSRVDARDPMQFFDEVGEALNEREPEEKNRCWRINFPNKGYYIDFTPSVPLEKIPLGQRQFVRYQPASGYDATALAVVDRPTGTWKTSNPAGFAEWVNDQAKRQLLVQPIQKAAALNERADIRPVPVQEVPLSDTLRVAIRLFKRHRCMAVRRGHLVGEFKPISVIIVTLLTQCYEGLADRNRRYSHPIELLVDLAELLPNMVERHNGEYVIANPTVHGENFAERWNTDSGRRAHTFHQWCKLLVTDLTYILAATDPAEVRKRVQKAFGCEGAAVPAATTQGLLSGLAPSQPRQVQPVRPGRGLA
jgi:hypothetical protein